MNNISGFGLLVTCIASSTFPAGFDITQFSDDADPFDLPSLQIAEAVMGLNGDLMVYSRANPIKVTINVIPGSDDDVNLSLLLEANRVGLGKTGARDIITMVATYPDDNVVTLINGVITDGIPVSSVASVGRLKTKSYSFSFENKVGL